MDHFKVSTGEILFILKEQLDYAGLCNLERYRGLDEDTLDMLVIEAVRFAKGVLSPLQEIGEKWGARLENGQVRCAPEFREAFRQFGKNGWIAVARDTRYGGQGFPHLMRIVVNDQMYGAAQSFNMGPSLTHGAGHLIETFGTTPLKEQFVPRMYKGQWAGTMCLTEPGAGSGLAAVRTRAVREGDHFRIRGAKAFISYGDHDMTENIIHLLLARIEGAPEGLRGLSLFVVPKIRVNPDGSPGEKNDVICTGLEKKLGLHGSPTCMLNFGDNDRCIGYLCGEENKGLAHMFQMVNQSRINTAVSGMTLASTAYRNALAYAGERIQGTDVAGRKPGYVPIIDHPDVRRMLIWMKAMVDGMRSMIYTAAFWSDLALELPRGDEKDHYRALLDFMTPMVKAYCSDMGFRVCETAIQCLGGYGYSKEYPLEQYLRDVKVLSIYEGTNGIQSMDLMGRKMRRKDDAPYRAFMTEIGAFLDRHRSHPTLGNEIRALSRTTERLADVARKSSSMLDFDPLQWASYTYPALLCFGDAAMAWRLLDMAVAAQKALEEGGENAFYRGKVMEATYFSGVTLPLTLARLETCMRPGREIVEIPDEAF
jgi:alkylation response protein AidB-like acyl-CoA dehydrogenase